MKIEVLESIIGDGRMASVDFVTKTGRPRTVNGRTGVVRYIKGTGRKQNPREQGQIIVWETLRPQDKDRDGYKRYKRVTADRVTAIRANGVEVRSR